MYIENFKFSTRNCFVVFTGAQYIFWFSGAGIFAIATRENAETVDPCGPQTFTLLVGNEYGPAGNNETAQKCKQLITRLENKYVKKQITFDVKTAKLQNFGAVVTVYENK